MEHEVLPNLIGYWYSPVFSPSNFGQAWSLKLPLEIGIDQPMFFFHKSKGHFTQFYRYEVWSVDADKFRVTNKISGGLHIYNIHMYIVYICICIYIYIYIQYTSIRLYTHLDSSLQTMQAYHDNDLSFKKKRRFTTHIYIYINTG